jgi:hypothetical protein
MFYAELDKCAVTHIGDALANTPGTEGARTSPAPGDIEPPAPVAAGQEAAAAAAAADAPAAPTLACIASRYAAIAEVYSHVGGLTHLVGAELTAEVHQLLATVDATAKGWLNAGRSLLSSVSALAPHANVIVTSGDLVPTYAKMIAYGLSSYVPIGNVFTSRHVGKNEAFRRAMAMFGPERAYVAIGDGEDERVAAQALTMPFFKVKGKSDLDRLLKHLTSITSGGTHSQQQQQQRQ